MEGEATVPRGEPQREALLSLSLPDGARPSELRKGRVRRPDQHFTSSRIIREGTRYASRSQARQRRLASTVRRAPDPPRQAKWHACPAGAHSADPKFNGCPDRRQPPPWTGSGRGRTRLCPTAPTAARGLRSMDPSPALCPGSSPETSPSQSPPRAPPEPPVQAGRRRVQDWGPWSAPPNPPSQVREPRCVRGRSAADSGSPGAAGTRASSVPPDGAAGAQGASLWQQVWLGPAALLWAECPLLPRAAPRQLSATDRTVRSTRGGHSACRVVPISRPLPAHPARTGLGPDQYA